jgi:hypothetical protein
MVLVIVVLKKEQGNFFYIFFNLFKFFYRKIPNTIVVVKTNYDKVIGGFTPLKWDLPKIENHEYILDKYGKTFLFSVSLKEKYSILENNLEFAICNASKMGPIFGAGSDLEIMNNADKNYNNYGLIGKTFDYIGIPENFYGNQKYLVVDYECYEVLL